MTILVKGMKMPRNCFCCSMSQLEDGRLFCCMLRDEVLRRRVDPDCPLVEVPTPHGRLIDVKDVQNEIDKVRPGRCYEDAWALTVMDNAPTVIEAEVEE